MQPNPTLDQLQVLIAIADTGSFSAAARQLNKAQSVVSYAISNLEDQLQLDLFDRSGSRQPVLTEAGKAVLEDARRMAAQLDSLRGRAAVLREGLEGELKLAVSVMVPEQALVAILTAFQKTFPTVQLNVNWGSGFMVSDMIETGNAHLGIGGAVMKVEDGIIVERLSQSYMLPVAAADHPLAKLNRPLLVADVRDEVQIVVSDSTGQTRGRDFNVFSMRTWRVGDMMTKHTLLRAGLGWGGMPGAIVEKDIRDGRLVRLQMDMFETSNFPIFAMWRSASPPGPAARWMMEQFRLFLGKCPSDMHEALGLLPPKAAAE
ncbi:LysR family transcriptional regulator [Rhizobium sp. PAMB 3174]